jgi:hypothetical protein
MHAASWPHEAGGPVTAVDACGMQYRSITTAKASAADPVVAQIAARSRAG